MSDETMEVLTAAGKPWRVNKAKFEAMRASLLEALPDEAPGITVTEAKEALLPTLDAALFPGGEKAGWWIKAVQLDHEARGLIKRSKGSPLRIYRTK
ncbi:hypothetical protein SLH49_16220 [Cognatiyoonia sp. IB215446]|uniref:DUF6958 family protein n=1 Tax=Cognatiyoonia sp. IB215446 TaxID=3097355 RepID=UPI002A0F9533|nr:hypothetical protein [Cognatiyoonia sp. IB215446]MDX8349530.1 hypothetical protein [Cognatiyoonia sp. IB215446]